MKILNYATGITETADLIVTKGISNVLFLASRTPEEFTTETISIWVERAGKNFEIVKEMPLKAFCYLATFGPDAILSDATYKTKALLSLTADGGFIALAENESIKIKMRGLVSTISYGLFGIEQPVPTIELLKYELKSISADDTTRDIDTIGMDLCVLTKHASIQEVQLSFDNGTTCVYEPLELEAETTSNDLLQYIGQTGTVQHTSASYYVIPLLGVVSMKVRKSTGTRLEFAMRIDEDDYIRYQLKN